jgi:hypothetical protein
MTPLVAIAGLPIAPVLALLACIVVFFAALIAPQRSIMLQHRIDRLLHKGADKAAENSPDAAGQTPAKPVDFSRRAIDKTAGAARTLRARLPF